MNHRVQYRCTPVRHWRAPAALVLMLASSAALALGLGDIRVKSRPGQPLVAEIPVISSDPAEMEHLTAQLASGDTFERVGLRRPSGLVRELNFAVGLSDDGKPVIRVTSAAPVTQPMLNFLVEVDWGQGRLVREYSALVNAPGSIASVAEPAVETPQAAPDNTIIRVPEPTPVATQPLPAPAQSAVPLVSAPASQAVPAAPRRAPPPSTHALAKASAKALQQGPITVRSGQTLSQIAARLDGGASLDQTMLALLHANPDAFIEGNINLLKVGAVLKLPPSGELAALNRSEAGAMVRQQMAEWRDWKQFRKPLPQPVSGAVAKTQVPSSATPNTMPADAQGHLEIAPAAADAAKRKGTTSGTQSGGQGDMLANTPLQQAKEDLATRDAEVQQLRAQVAELEKIKADQGKLIAMKDSDLAAAQHNLGKAGAAATMSAEWLWAGLGLLLLGLGLGWLIARTRVDKPVKSKKFDASRLPPVQPEARVSELFADVPMQHATPVETPAPLGKPAWHTGEDPATSVVLNPAPAGRERLELAIAYKDMGDVVTARELLGEVVVGNDADARTEAAQLLRELG